MYRKTLTCTYVELFQLPVCLNNRTISLVVRILYYYSPFPEMCFKALATYRAKAMVKMAVKPTSASYAACCKVESLAFIFLAVVPATAVKDFFFQIWSIPFSLSLSLYFLLTNLTLVFGNEVTTFHNNFRDLHSNVFFFGEKLSLRQKTVSLSLFFIFVLVVNAAECHELFAVKCDLY